MSRRGEMMRGDIGEGDLKEVLQRCRPVLARRWYQAVKRTGAVGLDAVSLRLELEWLADQTISALAADHCVQQQAQAIGRQLCEMQYLPPEALGSLLQALLEELPNAIPSDPETIQLPRLAELVNGISTGFLQQHRITVLSEQDTVQQALAMARREAEERLRVSEERYRAIVTQVAEGIVLTDASSGRILETSPSFQQLLGYTAEELAGKPVSDVVAHGQGSIDGNIRRVLRAGHSGVGERQLRRKHGALVTAEVSITAIATGSGAMLCCLVRDVTERVRAAAELTAARRGLGEAREVERLRLAHELHDGAVQELSAVRYRLMAGSKEIARGQPPDHLLPVLHSVEEQIATITEHLRTICSELRPPGLEELGLRGALENYLADLRRRGVALPIVTIDVDADSHQLPQSNTLCPYRVAQEALRNAFTHAAARQIVVRVRARPRTVTLRVSDDGCGFTVPKRLSALAQQGRFGLAGMAERLAEIDGHLLVRSRLGRGTTVTACVPARKRSEGGDGGDDPRSAGR